MKQLLTHLPVAVDRTLLILRIAAGAMILFGHGVAKLQKLNDSPVRFSDPIGLGPLPSLLLASLAEVICAAMLMAGYKTRIALIPLMITMLVAAFITHMDDPWGKKELPLLYFFVFLFIYFLGPGKYSLDA